MSPVVFHTWLCACAVVVTAPTALGAGTFTWEIAAIGEAGAVDLTPQPPGTTEATLGPGGIVKIEYFLDGWYPGFPGTTCGGVADGTACLVSDPGCVGDPDGTECLFPMTCGGAHNGTPCTADEGDPDVACQAGTRCFPNRGPLVLAYQVAPEFSTLSNGPGSSLGLAVIPCDENSDCGAFDFCPGDTCGAVPLGTECIGDAECVGDPNGETCGAACPACDDSLFIDRDRVDFIFYPNVKVCFDCGGCFSLGLGSAAVTDGMGADPGFPAYLGTLFLQLSENACGDFCLALDPALTAAEGENGSFDTDESATLTIHSTGACASGACCNMAAGTCEDDVIESDCLDPDEWTAGAACAALEPPCRAPCVIVATNPPGCESDPGHAGIDAGKPHDRDDATACNGLPGACGWDHLDIVFNPECDIGALVIDDFELEQRPADGPPAPSLSGPATAQNASTLRLQFSAPINWRYWACVSLRENPGERVCLGYLPGDVDGDGSVLPTDILAVVDSLNGSVPRPESCVDVDRSGLADPIDILEVVNLLNGAGHYPPMLNTTMEGWLHCPPPLVSR